MSKSTKEQVKFFIETMTDDMHNTTQHKIAETLLSKFDECELLQAKLLAYEQAGKETKIYQYQSCLFNDENGEKDWYWDDCDKGFFEQYDPAHRRIVYTAPVLPKQPEQVESLKKVMNSWLAMEPKLAYQPEFTDVMMLLDAEPASAQPVISRWPADEVERDALRYRFLRDKDFFGDEDEPGLVGWEELVELSYNEFDAAVDARISHPNIDYVKLDTALRKHIPAQPVRFAYKLPDGWKLVPLDPTAQEQK